MGLTVFSLVLFFIGLAASQSALAGSFVVNTAADSNDGSCGTPCSLRDAIAAANALAGADTILFDNTVFASPQAILLTSNLPSISGDLTIDGPSPALVTVDGASTYQAITTASGVTVALDGLTIDHSSASGGSGGAIFNQSGSTLTITSCAITNSQAALGGGIWSGGTLTILNSTISGNSSTTNAGGIANIGMLKLINSTVAGNSALSGGGLYSFNQMTVTNSTISGNSASNTGGGLLVFGGTTTLNNSIVANSTSGGDCSRTAGTINASSSLIEDGLACLNGTNSNNLTGDPALNSDLTLSASSPAINAGDNSLLPADTYDLDGDLDTTEPLPIDLAGNARVQNTTVDMGAYESPYTPYVAGAVNLTKSFTDDPVMPGDTVTLEVTLTNTDIAFAASDIAFTDDLAAALSGLVATGLPASNVCGAGSTLSGTSTLTFGGGSLAAGADCTFDVTLQVPGGASPDTYTNTTSTVSATVDGTTVTGTAGSDDLVVTAGALMTFDLSGGTTTAEGDSGTHTVDLTVTRDDTSVDGSVDITFSGSADASDYSVAVSGTGISYSAPTISFTGGGSSATVTLTIDGDAVLEPDETAVATLSNPSSSIGVALGTDTQTVTITNDDSAGSIPTLSVWGMAILACLLCFGTMYTLGRQRHDQTLDQR